MVVENKLSAHCPRCKKEISSSLVSFRDFSFYRLDIPFYICGSCGIAFLNRNKIKEAIDSWAKLFERKVSRKKIYNQVLPKMKEVLIYYRDKLGYELINFERKPRK